MKIEVLSRDRLFDLTRHREAGLFDRTIDVQIGRLRRKLKDDPKHPTIIKTVRGGGQRGVLAVGEVDLRHRPEYAAAIPIEQLQRNETRERPSCRLRCSALIQTVSFPSTRSSLTSEPSWRTLLLIAHGR